MLEQYRRLVTNIQDSVLYRTKWPNPNQAIAQENLVCSIQICNRELLDQGIPTKSGGHFKDRLAHGASDTGTGKRWCKQGVSTECKEVAHGACQCLSMAVEHQTFRECLLVWLAASQHLGQSIEVFDACQLGLSHDSSVTDTRHDAMYAISRKVIWRGLKHEDTGSGQLRVRTISSSTKATGDDDFQHATGTSPYHLAGLCPEQVVGRGSDAETPATPAQADKVGFEIECRTSANSDSFK